MKPCRDTKEKRKREREAKREKIRKQKKCFWQWPLGHCWHYDGNAYKCCGCAKCEYAGTGMR